MRIYLMARYGRRAEMLTVAADLEALGHEITARWIRGEHELDDHLLNTDPEFRNREGARFAEDDLADLCAADCAIAFTENPGIQTGRGRGGRHFEAGMALFCARYRYSERERAKQTGRTITLPQGPDRLICVGHRENVFMCLPDWEHYPDWPACLTALRAEGDPRGTDR